MRTYARIQNERVVELVTTSTDISTMFHPALMWVDASSETSVAEGWTYNGLIFSRPTAPKVVSPPLSISGMEAQLAVFAAQLAALAKAQ